MGQVESKIIGFFPFWFAIVVVNNSLANDPRVACDIKFEKWKQNLRKQISYISYPKRCGKSMKQNDKNQQMKELCCHYWIFRCSEPKCKWLSNEIFPKLIFLSKPWQSSPIYEKRCWKRFSCSLNLQNGYVLEK